MIQGDNFVLKGMKNHALPSKDVNMLRIDSTLPALVKVQYPALYNGGLPAEIPTYKHGKPRWFEKVKTISWSDFFHVEKNQIIIYRIVPHTNITNNNKRLWKMIHKMYEMYESPASRMERSGFKLHYREKDYLWFDIVFKQIKGEKKVEFYVATTQYQALKLKRKLENKMSITMTKAHQQDLHIPYQNTIVQELRYLHHDIFSLNTNTSDVKTPITNIMNTLDELQYDGDIARLSVCNEVENRSKWVKNAQWAYEKLRNGKVPQRPSANSKRLVTGAKVGIAGLLNEVNSLVVDTFQAFSNTFFKSSQRYTNEKVIKKPANVHDEVFTTRISHEKGNQPVFKSRIRVIAHSDDRLTRDTISETLALSLVDLSEINELHGVKVKLRARKEKIIDELNNFELSKRTKLDTNVNLISTDEMSKLALQMPNKEIQRRYADALSVKQRIEVDIPSAMQDPKGIYLGEATVRDTSVPIYIPVNNPDNFYRGYVFTGGQGAGKDTAIQNFVVEGNLKHGISFIIPDAIVEEGGRGMADGIRDALPPGNIIDLNLNDNDYIPPLDLTEVIEALGRNGSSRFADEMIDFINIEGLNRSEKYLTDAAKASNGSLFNIKRIIEDEEYRLQRIQELINEGNTRLAHELIHWGDNKELGTKCDAILHRLNRFFGNERLYDIFAQEPLKELDFAKWMSEGKVILLRVPNGRGLGAHAVKTLVHWITLKVFMTRLLMSKEDQSNGAFVVFNEPEQYESEGLTKLMGRIGTEGRKERLGSIYAFHHWNKLQPSLQENLQGGGVQQFLFRNDHTKTFELSKHRFEDTIPLEQAYRLPDHHAIISVRAAGDVQPAFICHMAPPVKQQYDNTKLTKQHTKQYGRCWRELQNIL